ncbi:MAG: M56 family metallopeptidase [Xanthomonadales bacterium]|nr:M56 family metallopeptidase [Xanthomonadales bacterium]
MSHDWIYYIMSWLMNYFIHSTLLLLVLLMALKTKLLKLDRVGEYLMKTALVLGVFTAWIQSNGWIPGNLQNKFFWQQTIDKPIEAEVKIPQPISQQLNNNLKSNDSLVTKRTPPVRSNQPEILTQHNDLSPGFWLIIWCFGLLGLGLRQVIMRRRFQHRISQRKLVDNAKWKQLFTQLIQQANLKPDIKLSQSDYLYSPIALANEVVLPEVFLKQPIEQIEAALAHELAHIKRQDYQWMKFSQWFQTLTFFQPLNRTINQNLHQLAELSADEMAAKWTQNPAALAQALFSVAERNIKHNNQWVPAMSNKKSKLLARIENIFHQSTSRTKPGFVLMYAAVVVMVLTAAPGVIAQKNGAVYHSQNSYLSKGSSYDIETDEGKTSMSVSHTDDNRSFKLKAKLSGEIKFNHDESQIVAFPANSKFDLTEEVKGEERRLVIKSIRGNDMPEYVYYENGDKKTYDDNAQKWLARIIPEIMRITGFNAKERVKRIHAKGGNPAVLEEIGLIDSDYVRRTYFGHLFKLDQLDDTDMNSTLKLAAEIKSDFELSHVLSAMVATQQIQDEQQWFNYLQATHTIQSDFELAKTMMNVMEYLPESTQVNESFFKAVQTIQSDFEMAKVLLAYLDGREPNSVNLEQMFVAAAEIQSDFELAKVLMSVNKNLENHEEAFGHYLDLAATISSDFEMKKVYSNLLQHKPSAVILNQMLNSAADQIGSDFELANLLVQVANQNHSNDAIKKKIIEVAKDKIGSSFDREKVFSAVL